MDHFIKYRDGTLFSTVFVISLCSNFKAEMQTRSECLQVTFQVIPCNTALASCSQQLFIVIKMSQIIDKGLSRSTRRVRLKLRTNRLIIIAILSYDL